MFVVRDRVRPAVWLAGWQTGAIYRNKEAALCCAAMQLLGLSLPWQRQSHPKANGKWKGTNKTVKNKQTNKQKNKQQRGRVIFLLPLEISALAVQPKLFAQPVCWLMNKAIIDSIHQWKSFQHKKKKKTQKLLEFYFILFIKLLLSCLQFYPKFLFKKNKKIK